MSIVFYHNPRCSKSRAVHALLQDRGLTFELVEYLKNPLDKPDLIRIIKGLDQPALSLIRTGDAAFKASGIDGSELDQEQIINLLMEHPAWLQRPVVLIDGQARIGRPIENVERILP